jgi:uncharacterized protein
MHKHFTRTFIAMLALAATLLLSFSFVHEAHAGGAEQKLALELTRLVVPKETYDAMLDQMMTNLMASMTQAGAKISAKDAGKLKDAVAEVIPYDEMVQWNTEIYASKFTADELKELIKFYNSPVGKKAAKILPEITGEVGKKTGQIVMQRLPAALKKRGIQ